MTDRQATALDVAALAVDVASRATLRAARDAHLAVTHRLFGPWRAVGIGWPEAAHDALVDGAYELGRAATALTGSSLRFLAAHGLGGRPLESTASGRQLVAAVNGLLGDQLRASGDPHTITMAVRSGGADLPLTRFAVGEALGPAAGSHLVVFLHDLLGSDESWSIGSATGLPGLVGARTSGTPVAVRYNTGLSPAENGRHLDILLTSLTAVWPVSPTRITLVGHGMGGLVARSAVNTALAHQRGWVPLVRDLVMLGEPQVGSAIEKAGAIGARAPFGFAPAIHTGHAGPDDWDGVHVTSVWGDGRQAAAPLPWADHWYAVTDPPSSGIVHDPRLAFLVVGWIEARDAAPPRIEI